MNSRKRKNIRFYLISFLSVLAACLLDELAEKNGWLPLRHLLVVLVMIALVFFKYFRFKIVWEDSSKE